MFDCTASCINERCGLFDKRATLYDLRLVLVYIILMSYYILHCICMSVALALLVRQRAQQWMW